MIKIFALCILTFMTHIQSAYAQKATSIAIIGDSLATGAATHPNMVYDTETLWKIFRGELSIEAGPEIFDNLTEFNIHESPVAPTLLWRASTQFREPLDWVYFNFIDAFSSHFLNTEQLSWGYFVGRKLGITPQNIYIAAENGASSRNLYAQIEKILAFNHRQLPEKIIIMFNGNDLCAPRIELATSTEEFAKNLREGLLYLTKQGVPHTSGTEVIIAAHMSVTQLVIDQEIQNKKVNFYGEQKTCQEVRQLKYLPDPKKLEQLQVNPLEKVLSKFIPPNPVEICHTLFASTPNSREQIGSLANRIGEYRKSQEELITFFQQSKPNLYPEKNFKFSYIADTGKILFKPEEIGPDCFHLSWIGQKRVASTILENMKNLKQ